MHVKSTPAGVTVRFDLADGGLTSAERPAVLSELVWLPRHPRHFPVSHKASAETFKVREG